MRNLGFIVVATAMALALGHTPSSDTPNHLQQVQKLFIKPSNDGTTGDLYVAATEESGSTAQWLTDQPVNFLSSLKNYDRLNPKRAIAGPLPSFGFPQAQPETPEAKATKTDCPYAQQMAQSSPGDGANETPCNGAEPTPYNPYGYFYPQIMASYANMANILKDTGMNEETVNSMIPQTPVLWPQAYAYPYSVQYMMVDPSAWAQSQNAQTQTENNAV